MNYPETPDKSWKSALRELPFGDPARYAGVETWIPPQGAPPFRKVSADELERRLAEASHMIEATAPKLCALLEVLYLNNAVAYLTDKDGIVLFATGDHQIIEQFCLSPGYDWSEKLMGPNGAGTALARRNPIAVVGREHSYSAFYDCTCTAAPIFAHDRSVLGAIDVSSSVADAKPDRLRAVIETAQAIEFELYQGWYRRSSK